MKCTCEVIPCCDLETQEWEHEIVECEYCAKVHAEHAEMLAWIKQFVRPPYVPMLNFDEVEALIARVEATRKGGK